MHTQSLVPFSKSKDYQLLSQRQTNTTGELWQKISKTGTPTGKVVGYQKLSEPKFGQASSSTINWSKTNGSSQQSRYLKCKITLNSARQKLQIIDKNEYGAEDNNQFFQLPSLRDFSLLDRFRLALGRNKILMELKQNDLGAWELKIDSKKTHLSQKLRAFSPTLSSRNKSLARHISALNDTIDSEQKFDNAKTSPYQYISPYLSPIDDPSNLIPKNFYTLSAGDKESLFKAPVEYHAYHLEKLSSLQPKENSKEYNLIFQHYWGLKYLAHKAKAFFPTSISSLSPNELGDIIENLSNQNLSGYGEQLKSLFQSQEEGNTDGPNYYDLEEWYKQKHDQFDIKSKETKDLLNAALEETFQLEKAKNKNTEVINLVSGTPSAFSDEEQISKLLEDLITSFCEAMPDGGMHTLLSEHSITPNSSTTESLCSFEKGISAVSFKLQQIYGLKLVPNTQDRKGNIHTYSLISDAPDNPETLGKIAITERKIEDKLGTSSFARLSCKYPHANSHLPPDTGTISLLLENPSQLNAHEIITLFHEVGHACEAFLNRPQHKDKPAPDGIPRDLAETPSQLLEFFAADEDVAQIIDAPNAKHVQSQIRDSLDKYNQLVGLDLIAAKAIFEVLTEKRSNAPEFQDFMDRAKKCLPEGISKALKKNSAEEAVLEKALFPAIQHAIGTDYKETFYRYPLGRLLAAVIKQRITENGTVNTKGRNSLINWYNGKDTNTDTDTDTDNKKDPPQSFNFLEAKITKGWTDEAVKALNIYSNKEAPHPGIKP